MGLNDFQDNIKEWIRQSYRDRRDILGQNPRYPLPRGPRGTGRSESAGRVYDLYNESTPEDQYTDEETLKNATKIKGLRGYVEKGYQMGGRIGKDSDFLHFDYEDEDEKPELPKMVRLYVNFDHSNTTHARNLANYLQRELKFRTGAGVVKFKIAGPRMPASRRDSAVIWVHKRGAVNRNNTAKTIASIIETSDGTVYGAGEIRNRNGIGYTYEPCRLSEDSWKCLYNIQDGLGVSFGSLISIYFAKALKGSESVDAYADKIKRLM